MEGQVRWKGSYMKASINDRTHMKNTVTENLVWGNKECGKINQNVHSQVYLMVQGQIFDTVYK